jgi:hypothetical protein
MSIITKRNTMKVVRTTWTLKLCKGTSWESFLRAVDTATIAANARIVDLDKDEDGVVSAEFEVEQPCE